MRNLVRLGAAVALVGGLSLVWFDSAAPSQAGPHLAPIATPLASPPAPVTSAPSCPNLPGVPISITADGARAQNTPVEAHGLGDVENGTTYGGSLYVPPDPRRASWLNYADVGPGADHGSAVFTSHVNYAGVLGAFGDLTSYRPGQHISVALADGRTISYSVVPATTMGFATEATALEVTKAQLDADPSLNARIYDFDSRWPDAGGAPCGRLVIVTCSGKVIDHNYQDNAFVFAVPDPGRT